MDGLFRTSRSQKKSRRLVTIALDMQKAPVCASQIAHIIKAINTVLNTSELGNYEPEFIEVDGKLHVPRITENTRLSNQLHGNYSVKSSTSMSFGRAGPIELVIGTDEDPGALNWVRHDGFGNPLAPQEVELEVKAAGFDPRDFSVHSRDLETFPGQSFTGVVCRVGDNVMGSFEIGDRVLALCPTSLKSVVRCDQSYVWKLEANM